MKPIRGFEVSNSSIGSFFCKPRLGEEDEVFRDKEIEDVLTEEGCVIHNTNIVRRFGIKKFFLIVITII